MTPLTPQDVASLLSVREFMKLCQFFDLKHAASKSNTVMMSGDLGLNGSAPMQFLRPAVAEIRFKVYGVTRTKLSLHVLCQATNSPLMNLDFGITNLRVMKSRKVKVQQEKEAS